MSCLEESKFKTWLKWFLSRLYFLSSCPFFLENWGLRKKNLQSLSCICFLTQYKKKGDLGLILTWNHLSEFVFLSLLVKYWFSYTFNFLSFVFVISSSHTTLFILIPPSLCVVILMSRLSAVFIWFRLKY